MEIVWSLVAGVLGGVFTFLVLRLVTPRHKDVDELALEVERLTRIVRRFQMSRVRAAASDAADPDPAALAPVSAAVATTDPQEAKRQLRMRALR